MKSGLGGMEGASGRSPKVPHLALGTLSFIVPLPSWEVGVEGEPRRCFPGTPPEDHPSPRPSRRSRGGPPTLQDLPSGVQDTPGSAQSSICTERRIRGCPRRSRCASWLARPSLEGYSAPAPQYRGGLRLTQSEMNTGQNMTRFSWPLSCFLDAHSHAGLAGGMCVCQGCPGWYGSLEEEGDAVSGGFKNTPPNSRPSTPTPRLGTSASGQSASSRLSGDGRVWGQWGAVQAAMGHPMGRETPQVGGSRAPPKSHVLHPAWTQALSLARLRVGRALHHAYPSVGESGGDGGMSRLSWVTGGGRFKSSRAPPKLHALYPAPRHWAGHRCKWAERFITPFWGWESLGVLFRLPWVTRGGRPSKWGVQELPQTPYPHPAPRH